MTGLKVAFVSQWYLPEPASQPVWIVDALKRQGVDVEVLTGIPNYPTGRVAVGYRALERRTESVRGTTVHRTPLYPGHDASPVKRVLNYASWALSSAVFGRRYLRKADVALVYSSPATAALPAMVARRLHRVPYVLLIQDVWPDSIFAAGFFAGRAGRLVRILTNYFVNQTYRQAAQIVVISVGMSDLLASRGVPAEKISVVPNWIGDLDEAEPEGHSLRGDLGLTEGDFLLMYAGNHGSAQALDSVVRAFAELAAHESSHLVLVGDGIGKPALEELARRTCPDRVHFVDPQPRATMAAMMAQADAQLVSLADRPLFAVTTPSKLQSVMAAGHPVLVSAAGDAASIVRNAHAGLAVNPEDPAELAAAVRQLRAMSSADRQQLGQNGRAFYEAQFSEAVGAAKLMSILAASTVP